MIVTTTEGVPGYPTGEILGVVYGKPPKKAKLEDIVEEAKNLGADAIVGLRMFVPPPDVWVGTSTTLRIVFYGTAVRLSGGFKKPEEQVTSKTVEPVVSSQVEAKGWK